MRRHFLASAAVMIGVIGTGLSINAQQQPAQATVTMSVATLAPPGSTWARVFDAWNREVRRRSSNSLSLRFYFGGVQGDESEVIRKIRTGRLDGGAVTAVGLSQIHRPAIVFQMPGMFSSYAGLDRARTALNAEISTSFQTANFELMGWADVGATRIFSNTAVRTPAELAATRPWVWRDDSVTPAFYTEINARPVSLQVPEVLSALQTGRINSLISTPVSSLALQWTTRITHVTDMQIGVTIGATVFGRAQFARLSAEHQTILRETGQQFHALARRNLRNDEQRAIAAFAQRNITVVTLDAAQRAAWNTVFTNTRNRLAGQIATADFINRVRSLGQ